METDLLPQPAVWDLVARDQGVDRVATDVEQAIAACARTFITDGCTLQTGIGGVPSMVVSLLAEQDGGDYGVHSEMFTTGLMRLHQAGIKTYWTEHGTGAVPDATFDEVAGNIDQQSTPWETRPVFNGHSGDGKAVFIRLHELQESLHSAHQAKGIGSADAGHLAGRLPAGDPALGGG